MLVPDACGVQLPGGFSEGEVIGVIDELLACFFLRQFSDPDRQAILRRGVHRPPKDRGAAVGHVESFLRRQVKRGRFAREASWNAGSCATVAKAD